MPHAPWQSALRQESGQTNAPMTTVSLLPLRGEPFSPGPCRGRFANRPYDAVSFTLERWVWIPVFTGMTGCVVRPSTGSAVSRFRPDPVRAVREPPLRCGFVHARTMGLDSRFHGNDGMRGAPSTSSREPCRSARGERDRPVVVVESPPDIRRRWATRLTDLRLRVPKC